MHEGFDEVFFESLFESGILNPEIEKIAQEGGRNHGLLNVSVKDFFECVQFAVPTLPEQQKIAACLSALDAKVLAQAEQVRLLQDHKQGLMQQLFPSLSA